MKKKAVEITVNGEPGHRYSVRCRCCKSRWVEEHAKAEVLRGTFQGNLGRSHSCPKVDEWKSKHPYTTVSMSAFRSEILLWAPKSNGSTSKCGGLCMGAKGPNCDCNCHGKNHGKGWSGAIELDQVDAFLPVAK